MIYPQMYHRPRQVLEISLSYQQQLLLQLQRDQPPLFAFWLPLPLVIVSAQQLSSQPALFIPFLLSFLHP